MNRFHSLLALRFLAVLAAFAGCGVLPAALPASPAAPAPAARPIAPPRPPANVIFRPTFLTPDLGHNAGMAFRLKHEKSGRHYLASSHSLFGPAADLDVQMTSDDIARLVVAVVGVSCTDPKHLVVARPYVRLPGARRSDEAGSEKDIALFALTAVSDEPALVLDPGVPIKGERVWIYVKYPGTNRVGLEGATIAYTSDKELRYLLDNPLAELGGTTGAPVLSDEGLVVGMQLGTFNRKSGNVYGYACPASALWKVIEPDRVPPKSPLK